MFAPILSTATMVLGPFAGPLLGALSESPDDLVIKIVTKVIANAQSAKITLIIIR